MKALQIRRSVRRFGMARLTSPLSPSGAVRVGPVELTDVSEPARPTGPGWHRFETSLAGICGSDLSLIDGHASSYFDDWVSFPFVPGHEVVGRLEDGRRVVLEPVLGHAARGAVPPWPDAAPGDGHDYAHLVTGPLEPGIQTGFCCSTGGGWSPWFWAHESQLHFLPDHMPDERAVLVEPIAGAVHGAVMAANSPTERRNGVIAVLGAGTMGLASIAAVRQQIPDGLIVAGGRYPHQLTLAKEFGADVVTDGGGLARAVRRATGSHRIGSALSGGADVVIDAVGSSESISGAITMARPGGTVVLLGMPAEVSLDLTALWHRQVNLRGCYTYGTELVNEQPVRTFDIAVQLADMIGAERLLSATYPLERHVDALAHAAAAGRRGAVKIAFDLRGAN
jgi:threonine dehydrogenase-like Zn-dependent dehydrogenase